MIRFGPVMYAALLAAMVVIVPSAALAQADSMAEKQLARSRVAYELRLEAIRQSVERQIKAAKDRAAKLKDNTAAVSAALAAEKEFAASGKIPEGKGEDKLAQEYAEAAADMRKAYNDARLAASGDSQLTAEAEQFWRHWDLVPWRENLINAIPSGNRTLAPGGKPLSVNLNLGGPYRLEVKGRRSGETGALKIEIPVPGKGRLEIPVTADEKGRFRVLLTVMNTTVCADLGVARPIDIGRTRAGNEAGVSIQSVDGPVALELVRAKPVVPGEPPEVAEKPTKKDRTRETAVDPLPLGAKGEGIASTTEQPRAACGQQ